ncbi:uncharacterized protein LOC105191152 isoform X2 [Harpegnathos saltator]|uniref:uncharacterized protein LOC105191152 isoform X2 n=1 Tax=Harpegnathos saltator TaxID=610380 RepID=UPI00058BAAD3|nr:uncharacterized protein LOC105191152 isoform X2 [Harpegnathos saltator]
MLRIILAFLLGALLDVILCETQISEITNANQASSCRNPPLCDLSDMYKMEPRSASSLPFHLNSPNYITSQQSNHLQRSYYSGFGTSASPAHYHTFDPISVLASLAFLAFLLQSFASLYDRSRSMLPTIVSGRRESSDTDLTIPEISRHVSRVLRDYESFNNNLDARYVRRE